MSAILAFLLEKYGVALTFEEAATVLKYRSLAAAKSARQRGTFPIAIRKAGDRHLCSATDVASFLDGVAEPLSPPTPKPRRGCPTKAMVMARQEREKNKIAAVIAKGRMT